ncbi:MAG: hypothetical protein JW703_04490 [Candidatus Diapherotrites archaeon]|nr:hypothetical protein [Candidatus Diapherotrites archaeon]
MDLLAELKENKNIILSFKSHSNHKQELINILKSIDSKFNSICFITFNQTAKTLIDELEKNKLNPEKYFFIDSISEEIKSNGSVKNCLSVSSPTSLTELSIAFLKLSHQSPELTEFKTKKIDLILFDSISSLLLYNSEIKTVKFLHYFFNSIKSNNLKSIFIILEEDIQKNVVKEIELFADKVIKI